MVTMSTPIAGEVGEAAGDLVGRLAQPDHEPGLGDQPGGLGPGQHREAAGVAGRRPHGALQPGDGLDVVVEHVGAGGEQQLERRCVAVGVGDQRLDRVAGQCAADRRRRRRRRAPCRRRRGRRARPSSARRARRPSGRPPRRRVPARRRRAPRGLRVSTRQKPHARVQRSPSTMNVAVPSAQHSLRFGHPASSHTVTRSRSRTVCFSASTSGPWCTLGRSHSGLRSPIDSPPRDTRPAPVRCTDRSSPGPSPRENGARSSGRCFQATSWRSIVAVAPHRRGPPGDDVGDLLERHVDALLGQRGDRPVGDAARDDVVAHVAHVRGDVEGEAVHRAPARQAHADGADLARVRPGDADPHARVLVEAADVGDAELGERADDQPLDGAHVVAGPERVGHARRSGSRRAGRAVVGDVAAALDRHQLGADGRRARP